MIDGLEWDEANIAARGVDFADAVEIVRGPVVERVDGRRDHGEERVRAMGRTGDDVCVVAYVRRGSSRRIIGAWKVGDDGRRRYRATFDG